MEPKPIVELHTYIFGILLMNSYDKCRYIFLATTIICSLSTLNWRVKWSRHVTYSQLQQSWGTASSLSSGINVRGAVSDNVMSLNGSFSLDVILMLFWCYSDVIPMLFWWTSMTKHTVYHYALYTEYSGIFSNKQLAPWCLIKILAESATILFLATNVNFQRKKTKNSTLFI